MTPTASPAAPAVSRRSFVRSCVLGATGLAVSAALAGCGSSHSGDSSSGSVAVTNLANLKGFAFAVPISFTSGFAPISGSAILDNSFADIAAPSVTSFSYAELTQRLAPTFTITTDPGGRLLDTITLSLVGLTLAFGEALIDSAGSPVAPGILPADGVIRVSGRPVTFPQAQITASSSGTSTGTSTSTSTSTSTGTATGASNSTSNNASSNPLVFTRAPNTSSTAPNSALYTSGGGGELAFAPVRVTGGDATRLLALLTTPSGTSNTNFFVATLTFNAIYDGTAGAPGTLKWAFGSNELRVG